MVTLRIKLAEVVFGNEDFFKSQTVGLGDALLHTGHGAHLTREA